MKNNDLRTLTRLALLVAIELVMKAIGLGSVPMGPLYMSFLTLPIAVGAITMGPVAGAVLGGVCGALGALDLSLIMTHEGDWQSFLRMMDIFLRVNQGVQTGQIVLAIVFYLVLVLLSLLTFFAMAYFAITLSHTLFRDKKWRTWVALLIFVGVYWGLSYLQGLLPNPVENLVFTTANDPNAEITIATFADMIPQMLPYALYDLAIVLLSLFGCGWMLDKKVSL